MGAHACMRKPVAAPPHPRDLLRLTQFGGGSTAHACPLWSLRPAAAVPKRKPDGKTRVLILMSDTGGGHRASAEAIKAGEHSVCPTPAQQPVHAILQSMRGQAAPGSCFLLGGDSSALSRADGLSAAAQPAWTLQRNRTVRAHCCACVHCVPGLRSSACWPHRRPRFRPHCRV